MSKKKSKIGGDYEIVDMLLEITPNCLSHIEIHPTNPYHFWGEATYLYKDKVYVIKTSNPLETWENLLVFLHECAHIVLGHCEMNPITEKPAHPFHNTYAGEVMAWAKVFRWLDHYNIDCPPRKCIAESALKTAWDKLHIPSTITRSIRVSYISADGRIKPIRRRQP